MRTLLVVLASLLGGCTAVLDADDHRGGGDGGAGDAGECDTDGDGVLAMDCGGDDCDDGDPDRYPGAPPICGNGVDESCPGDLPLEPTDLFAGAAVQGLLPPRRVLESANGYLPDIAMAATDMGGAGHGLALVFAMEGDGSGTHAPVRLDVPLNDPTDGERGLLREFGSGADLSATSTVTSVDARELGSGVVGVHLVNSDGEEKWLGDIDMPAATADLGHDTGPFLDEPGVVPGPMALWRETATPTELQSQTFAAPAFFVGSTNVGVPSGNPIRMVTTDSEHAMLQDGAGDFVFWGGFSTEDPSSDTYPDQSGKAAWAHVDGSVHVLALQESGTVRFIPYECPSGDEACALQPTVSGWASVASGPMGGEVPDGHVLPDGRVMFLIVERHNDGDRLVMQILDGSLFDVSDPRIPLMDLRGSTVDRVTDARIDIVQGGSVITIAVAAAVREGTDGDAAAVAFTGLRACAED